MSVNLSRVATGDGLRKTMNPVLHSFAYSIDYLREQVADVAEAEMFAQPSAIMNHPAWTIGHLTVVSQNIGGVIGIPVWLPDGWAERYGTGSKPVAEAGLYESKGFLLNMVGDAQYRLTQAVRQLVDFQLDQPFPDESYLDVFPTVRHALTQVLVAHTANHVGQVSVWRQAMGLPPMSRSFE